MQGGEPARNGLALNATTRTEHHVVATVLVFPELGVAHVAREVFGVVVRAEHHALFAERATVLALDENGIGTSPRVDVVERGVRIGELDVARVKDAHAPVLDEGGAGVDAVDVEGFVGQKRRSNVLPRHKIMTLKMTPALDPAQAIEGRILKIQVIHPVLLTEAVRVVHPTGRRHRMQELGEFAVALAGGALVDGGDDLGEVALKRIGHRDSSTDSEMARRAQRELRRAPRGMSVYVRPRQEPRP